MRFTLRRTNSQSSPAGQRKVAALTPPTFNKLLLAAVAMVFAIPAVCLATNDNHVEAVQYGKSLYIFGDENDNGIRIGQFANGDIVVEGIECGGQVTDVIANDEEDMAVFSDVKNIFVNLGGGNDCVAATNDLFLLADCLGLGRGYFGQPGQPEAFVDLGESIFIPGELEIVTGQGNDEVYVGGFETGGAMEAYTQAGNDTVGLCDIYVGTNLLVYTSSGEDQVKIVGLNNFVEPATFVEMEGPQNYVRFKALINTSSDDDEVCVENLFTDVGQLKILTFGGNDRVAIGNCEPFMKPREPEGESDQQSFDEGPFYPSFGFVDVGTTLTVDTGTGEDDVAIGNTLVGTSLIGVLGDGVDELLIEDVSVGRSTILDTGDENDGVWINFFDTENDLVLHTRGGSDEVLIANSLVGRNLVTTLGTDSDGLYIDNVGVGNLTFVNAGSGNDFTYLYGVDSNRMQFIMGGGDDELWIEYSSASNLYANGGSGIDCFGEYSNSFSSGTVRNFELECDE